MEKKDFALVNKVLVLACYGQQKVLQGVLNLDPEVRNLPRLTSEQIQLFFDNYLALISKEE